MTSRDVIVEAARQVVAEAPEPTDAQLATVAALLQPDLDAAAVRSVPAARRARRRAA
jgi:hypothetical protein